WPALDFDVLLAGAGPRHETNEPLLQAGPGNEGGVRVGGEAGLLVGKENAVQVKPAQQERANQVHQNTANLRLHGSMVLELFFADVQINLRVHKGEANAFWKIIRSHPGSKTGESKDCWRDVQARVINDALGGGHGRPGCSSCGTS